MNPSRVVKLDDVPTLVVAEVSPRSTQ